jgi:IstB-like ATP binding protein
MTMERTEVLEMMGELKLYGMKSAYDETLATALKRKHEPQQLVGDLLKAEISEKQARSIRYQLTTAKLPLAKDVNDFAFKDTLINENLVRDLPGGVFVAQQRNVVLVGGTGTGKTHLAIAIAARPPHTSLRHRRNRQRELALQEPRLSINNLLPDQPRSPRLRNPNQLRRGERCRLDPSPTKGFLLHADLGVRFRAD